MTTFQDPPPQSRRSARQSERGEEPDAPTGFADADVAAPPSEQHPDAAFAPTPPPLIEPDAGDGQPLTRSGRRAREAAQQGLYEVQPSQGEPLDYMTQGRGEPLSYQAPEPQVPPAPRPEATAFAPAPPARSLPSSPASPEQAESAAPQFRVRDFSPEGRVTGRRAAAPPLIEPGSAPSAPPSDLEYRTEVGPATVNIPADEAAPVAVPPVAAMTVPTPVVSVPAEPVPVEPVVADTATFTTDDVDVMAPELVTVAEWELAGEPIAEPEPSAVPEPFAEPEVAAEQEHAAEPEPGLEQQAPSGTHHTLTRREMRARLAEESAASLDQAPAPDVNAALVTGSQPPVVVDPALVTGTQPPVVVDPALVTGSQPPPPLVDPSLITGPSARTGPQAPPPLVTPAPPPSSAPLFSAPPSSAPPSSAPLFSAAPPQPAPPAAAAPLEPLPAPPSSSADDEESEFESLSRTGQLAPPSASQRVGENTTPAAPSFLAPMPEPELDPDLEHTGGWVPPVGHWSRQADLDDETQPWENTVTREVGGGNVATTTSALVLPEMPRANPFPPALNATGEILLTGSIELPRSLSAVGGDSRHFDDSDVDLMYDDKEREFAGTDSSPVSAIRAVSTHTSARGVISSANKPHGNRMLTVLLITAAVMAVGVVGLLIAGLAGRIF